MQYTAYYILEGHLCQAGKARSRRMLFIRANAGQGGDDGGSELREVGFRLGATLILSNGCRGEVEEAEWL